eukprot:Amastigsp_a175641_20.p4 type:complete len:126 gc:universal Amastigsp_a175641_20:735-358(-)
MLCDALRDQHLATSPQLLRKLCCTVHGVAVDVAGEHQAAAPVHTDLELERVLRELDRAVVFFAEGHHRGAERERVRRLLEVHKHPAVLCFDQRGPGARGATAHNLPHSHDEPKRVHNALLFRDLA